MGLHPLKLGTASHDGQDGEYGIHPVPHQGKVRKNRSRSERGKFGATQPNTKGILGLAAVHNVERSENSFTAPTNQGSAASELVRLTATLAAKSSTCSTPSTILPTTSLRGGTATSAWSGSTTRWCTLTSSRGRQSRPRGRASRITCP